MRNSGAFKNSLWIGFVLITFVLVSPAEDKIETHSLANGRMWDLMGNYKIYYLMGLANGMIVGLAKGNHQLTPEEADKIFHETFPVKFSRGEVRSAVDKFYEDTSNIIIPIPGAVEWVTRKMNGASPTELEEFLTTLRKESIKKK